MEPFQDSIPRTASALARGRQTHRLTKLSLFASVALNLAYPVWYDWREDRQQKVVVLDVQSASLLACPVVDEASSEVIVWSCTQACAYLYERSVVGFRYPEYLRLLFSRAAYRQAQDEWEKEAQEYKAKSLGATVDVHRIRSQPLSGGRVSAQVDCILRLSGRVNGEPMEEDRPFTVTYTLAVNDDLLHRGRYPLMVLDYAYPKPVLPATAKTSNQNR